MQKMYTPVRIGVLFAVLAVMLTVYVSALYVIQIHEPWTQGSEPTEQRLITRRITVPAARGNIYDRNGVLLSSGRPSYNIRVDRLALLAAPNTNEIVLELVYAAMDEGLTYTDTFPVTRGAPFEFLSNMSTTQRNRLDAYLEFFRLDPEISVADLLAWMRNHYRIDYTVGILDARLIIGVRYELEIRAIVHAITPYIFAADVDTDFVSFLEERGLNGVFAESTFVREYHTPHAAHLLGYVGPMTAEEFEIYRELDYPMDAIVGKVGAEFAFERYLHGSAGEQVIRMTEDGTVRSVEMETMPVPGNHVTLTIDLDLQIVAEHALRTQIEGINHERERARLARLESDIEEEEEEEDDLIPGGAVVVVDVNTGEVLATASYPTFNLQTLSEDWALLHNDPTFPMLNRATQGRYAPGSTFKMVTALAGLRHVGVITRYFPIYDTGVFDRYEDVGFTASCWIFRENRVGHGDVSLIPALTVSCNYYFLQIADWLPGGASPGARILGETALEFGLGQNTGIELPEFAGRLATPEAREAATGETSWWTADTLLAGFGQGDSRFTPLQLANYAATIANGGTLNSLSVLRTIRTPEDFEVIHMHIPEVLNVIEDTEYLEMLQEGMVAASRERRGTAHAVFGNYPITVASKTGTVQIEGLAWNNGVFVCYAPADNPEIAIGIVVEKGGSGSAIMDIARIILDHYFMTESPFLATPYGQLVP